MRLLPRKRFRRDFVDYTFSNADGGNSQIAHVEIAPQSDEDDAGDAHYIGSIAANAVRFHASANVHAKQLRQAFAKKR